VLVSASLVFVAIEQKESMVIIMLSVTVPFLFTGFWNIYSVFYEKKISAPNEYFVYKSINSIGVGAFYHKAIVIPVFLIIFGSSALAIISAFLVKGNEEIAIVLTSVSFVYALTVTVYFLTRLNRVADENSENLQTRVDNTGFKIALFFAGLATIGLVPLGYYLFRKYKSKTGN
jgi:hypothetical protein